MCFVLGAVTGCELLTTDVFSQRRARSHLGAVKGALAGDVSPSQRLSGPPRARPVRHTLGFVITHSGFRVGCETGPHLAWGSGRRCGDDRAAAAVRGPVRAPFRCNGPRVQQGRLLPSLAPPPRSSRPAALSTPRHCTPFRPLCSWRPVTPVSSGLRGASGHR